jgi:hypothetical protein
MPEAFCAKCDAVVASGPDKASVAASAKRHAAQKHSLWKSAKKT